MKLTELPRNRNKDERRGTVKSRLHSKHHSSNNLRFEWSPKIETPERFTRADTEIRDDA